MKKFGKVIRIIGLIWGLFIFGAMLAMLLIPDGRESLFKGSSIPTVLIFVILISVMGLGLFLTIYNIVCLKKGIDVFFWMIFKRNAYKNGDYKRIEPKYTSSSSGSSYTPKPSPTPRPASTPKPQKTYHEFDWPEIQSAVKAIHRTQIWGFNAYIEVEDCYTKELSEYTYRIDVSLRAYGSATIRDEVDASRFKSASSSAIDTMCKYVNDKVRELHDRYGFGYETNFTGVEDNVNYSNY